MGEYDSSIQNFMFEKNFTEKSNIFKFFGSLEGLSGGEELLKKIFWRVEAVHILSTFLWKWTFV